MNAVFERSIFHFPEYRPTVLDEYAFAGRSNVGKSSLINAALGCRIAHVSKTPGKTRCINFFTVEGKVRIADLPGYGYAKVPMEMQAAWQHLIEGYLEHSPRLRRVFILADVQRGPAVEETELVRWLDHVQRPHTFVFTKIDKLTRQELLAVQRQPWAAGAVFFSSRTGAGKREILRLLGL